MFNYDGYLNEDYPSFIWLLIPAALISTAAASALYFLPAYANLIFGTAVVLTIFFEAWLALGGKRWMLAWSLITIAPLTIALLVVYNSHPYIPLLVYLLPLNAFIAVDALYYRRLIPGILHISLALFITVILLCVSNLYPYTIIAYFGIYAIIRLIDYVAIRLILSGRDSREDS